MIGHVVRVIASRGFAFIRARDVDYFLHVKDWHGSLLFDERLVGIDANFNVRETERGPRAMNARPLD
jgi:hypothetical protein